MSYSHGYAGRRESDVLPTCKHCGRPVYYGTDGTKNACSMLYGACRRAGKAMGYKRFLTYTLPEEGGAALRGAGWELVGEAGGGSWSRESRPRVDKHPTQTKLRWEATA